MRGIMQKRRNVSSLGRIQRLTRRFAARNDRKWNDIEETMDIIFYIGQALGVITVILGIVNYQVKTRQQVLAVHMATTICFSLHYLCLGAWAGMAMNLVGTVRNLVFYHLGKKGKVNRGWAIGFALVLGTMGTAASLIAGEAWYFVISVVALMINSFSMSFTEPQNIRKSILVTSPMVLIYDLFVSSYGGMVYEAVVIVSSIVGLVRYRKNRESVK